MKATELRIGNLVNYKIVDELDYRKEWYEVSKIDFDDLRILGIKDEMNQDYQPIPLSEEWLLNFGFEKSIENNGTLPCYKKGKYTIAKWNKGEYQFWMNTFDIYNSPQYVHQLQNLYFALTGTELNLNK